MSRTLQQFVLILLAGALLLLAGWSSYSVYKYSSEVADIKRDYSELNSITHGIMSVNIWRDHLTTMVLNRIDEFEFTEAQEDTLVHQVENILTAGIDKGADILDQKQKGIKAKLRKFAVKTLVPEDKIRALVPMFAQTIVNEIQKPENKEALKYVIKSKLQEYSDLTYDDSQIATLRIKALLDKYEVEDLIEFNKKIPEKIFDLEAETYFHTYILLGIIGVFLLLWWLLRNQKAVHTPLFIISVLVSLVVLFSGLTAPMIEIDARFQQVNFSLIGESITFNDQVIFFQSKSILEVIGILLNTGKIDSYFVGFLILVFSIVFPVAKLLATQIYLAGNDKARKNKVLKFFAFKSGKWSMADVYVIAVFMAYIGFQGILDNQLSNLNMETDSLVSISTNKTSLQPGFMIFIGFVLFSLILSTILKRITTTEKKIIKQEK
ncbi:paraquat-inducible protein A [Antarcticibacterium flavum]|uniref:Paraquat-inducible protein A n=1 Tax=Antarcticibacterium flavum TaxID=2058175 RepID=A0A5B7WZ36_9FLAO|nr:MULTISPECIES: paraquat-inducible protein A [Antarcticibacterium]MCM4161815.1 paraquat-inducible protein A [Antarcticibacterium sp. W02-3]QCY68379.1 paraquat-inducible protein A [Antarcticibacterium flavum]